MWSTLAELAERHHLTVRDHVPGRQPASAPVREGNTDRFEIGRVEWSGQLLEARRGEDPDALLSEALAAARLVEQGSGWVRLKLTDRFGGEQLTVTDAPRDRDDDDPLAVLLGRMRGW